MAYRIQDMLCELSIEELEEIRAFLNGLIKEKTDKEQEENGN